MSEDFETQIGDPRGAQAVARFLRDWFADQDAGRQRAKEEYLADAGEFAGAVEHAWMRVAGDDETLGAPAPIHTVHLGPGDRLGSYRILDEIGSGGQGVVYSARDERIGRRVAIKVLRDRGDRQVRLRFAREARVAANLDHPGICAVLEVHLEERPPYIVLPWIEGDPLSRIIATDGAAADRAEMDRRLLMVERAARALHSAHEVGVIHRDVKPGNIMVRENGQIVVLDFGLAQWVDAAEATTLTSQGQLLGTLPFMSPEQLRGRELDRRTDVYSLAVTLHELVTGELPHEGVEVGDRINAIVNGRRRETSASLRRLAPDLLAVLDVGLDVDPARRYASMVDLAEDLRRVREREPVLARPAGPRVRLTRWCARHPALALMTATAFAILVVGLLVSLHLLSRVDEQRRLANDRLAAAERLADLGLLDDLVDRDALAWPIGNGVTDDLRAWLRDRDALVARLPRHEADLSALDAGGTGDGQARRDRRILAEIVRRGARLRDDGEVAAEMRRRLEAATASRRETLERPAEDWRSAAARVAADGRFEGFTLVPREGLVPLGPDPSSGLEEFASWASGTVPGRDPVSGLLRASVDAAAVMVLLPPAWAVIGASRSASDDFEGHVDPRARDIESPIHEVRLDAFMIGKHELTQSQFMRVWRANPSENYKSSKGDERLGHPIDTIDWETARAAARRLGGDLPTEVQWEYACRAGTTTVFSCGDAAGDLAGFANIGDEGARAEYHDGWVFEAGFDDGFAGHAPVGSLESNAFGLHDMHGNLFEWCRDHFGPYTSPAADGDGLREPEDARYRMARGGSFFWNSYLARSAHRELLVAEEARMHLGMRLVIELSAP